MSHELRTPINAIIGYTALLLEGIYGDLLPKQREPLHVQAPPQHLLALIDDILDLAKIEAGKMPVHLERVALNAMVAELTSRSSRWCRRKARLHRGDPPEPPSMQTDRTKLKQVLLNLLSNAMKFTKGGVARAPAAVGVRIDVNDTGIGIRPEHLSVIFEDFRQVDQSPTREYGGTGLGLSITRKLVDLLGGDVAVESTYGGGQHLLGDTPASTVKRSRRTSR